MEAVIRAVLSNPSLTFVALGLVAAAVAIARMPAPRAAVGVYDALLRWYLFFSIGAGMLYNFVVHVFFGASTARFIGWADSPFQTEVGLASLGFSAVGFLAYRRGFDVRLAAVLGPACFLIGAGVGHVRQIVTTGNLAAGNAGVVLYTDFLLPVLGFALLWRWRRASA
ncbi:MAG: hypothetical protein IPM22_03485 [Betaproteobacteria bacterium]|nr:hypothetical protein [Betaproteobacteria bacterium]